MTAAKSTTRRRRSGTDNLPAPLVAWFRGELDKPPLRWALAFPGWALLPERWLAWVAEHPGATPPVGYEWLADPEHPRHKVYGPALANARRIARAGTAR